MSNLQIKVPTSLKLGLKETGRAWKRSRTLRVRAVGKSMLLEAGGKGTLMNR